MKKVMALAGMLLMSSVISAQTARFLTGSFDEALAEAKREKKLLFVEFFSSG
jgi:hypothetical protein